MCSYLVQAILQCFYKNMHLPIVLCCDMKILYQQNLITTIGCEFHKIVSLYQVYMMCVSVPFSKLHEHACSYCFSCWYEDKLWRCFSLLYQVSCMSIVC